MGYPEQGAICPDESQLLWLTAFRDAIAECAPDEKNPLRLTVRGFASVAPVKVAGGGPDASDRMNLDIANRRGVAIGNFLASGAYRRDCVPDRNCCERTTELMCGDGNWPADGDCRTEANYVVRYKPWPSYEAMVCSKPAHDGARPGHTHYKVEFLNRAVHMVVTNDACWQKVFRT